MKYFVISDTHFGHENVIRYCNRPFRNAEEMDETMIKNWNESVSNHDTVIHLGDFCLGNKEYAESIIKRLNGKKILVMGTTITGRNSSTETLGSIRFPGFQLYTTVSS